MLWHAWFKLRKHKHKVTNFLALVYAPYTINHTPYKHTALEQRTGWRFSVVRGPMGHFLSYQQHKCWRMARRHVYTKGVSDAFFSRLSYAHLTELIDSYFDQSSCLYSQHFTCALHAEPQPEAYMYTSSLQFTCMTIMTVKYALSTSKHVSPRLCTEPEHVQHRHIQSNGAAAALLMCCSRYTPGVTLVGSSMRLFSHSEYFKL